VEGARVGLLVGVGLGLASVGSGTARTFRPPQWVLYFVLFVVLTTAIAAALGAGAGLLVRWVQRRRLDRELTELTKPPPASSRRNGEERGELRGR
jgi:hypothetical protein